MTLKRLSWPRPSFSLKKSCSGYVRAMSRRMTYHTFFVREGCVILLSYHPQIHHRIEEMMKEWKIKKDGNLFTGGCGFDILGVLRLGRRVIGAAQQWPDDASEMMRDPFADEVLDVGISLLVCIGPVGHQTAPKAPLILFVVVRTRLLTVGTGTCRVSQNANIQIFKKKKKNNK